MKDLKSCASSWVSAIAAVVATGCGVAEESGTPNSESSAPTDSTGVVTTSTPTPPPSLASTQADESKAPSSASADVTSAFSEDPSSNPRSSEDGEGSTAFVTSGPSFDTSAATSSALGSEALSTDETSEPVAPPEIEPLDCGPDGWVVENHGPPENRVNYIILGDGYDSTTIDTTLEEHIQTAMDRRFGHESGEPYGRYRKFVNICVMKVVSETNGIGNGPTAFDGGNGGQALARVDTRKVRAYLDENLPERVEPSWTAVVLNQAKWENTGSMVMLWSGGNNDAAGAALHEGGHGFHQLADEYGTCTGARCGEDTNGSGPTGEEYQEVNSTGNPGTTGSKWDLWFGSTQKAIKDPNGEATGLQSTFSGSRYEGESEGQYRPSANSMMNSLFGLRPDTSFNAVSREQMVFSIWQFVRPIDSTVPEAGPVDGKGVLQVNVIDPDVISVDWSVDGEMVAENGGVTFNTQELTSGEHVVEARAYDNATEDLVRLRTSVCPPSVRQHYCHGTAWKNSEQTVEWSVTIR
jgi:hypothetical protein